MRKNLRFLGGAAIGCMLALVSNSCTYEPYYTTTVGGAYGPAYGPTYGNNSFSTSVFVNTGNPRWGYDPVCYSYYDYSRRCYYDPYLNGYYPTGYRPPVVYGVAHPYGWYPGANYCRPPSRVTNVTITNYQSRESSYRSAGYITASTRYGPRPIASPYRGGSYQPRPTYHQPYHTHFKPAQQYPKSKIPQQRMGNPSRNNQLVTNYQANPTRVNRSKPSDPRGGQSPAKNPLLPLAPADTTGESERRKPRSDGGDPRGQSGR